MTIEIHLSHEPLAMDDILAPGAGAVMRFTGVVRPLENDCPISALVYEGYEPMAARVIQDIIATLGESHPADHVRVQHRLGHIPVGEAAIIVEVASKHRGPAIEIISKFMDQLKLEVPIWKTRAIAQ
jgi:molybdopterin synthase catalytic subunit